MNLSKIVLRRVYLVPMAQAIDADVPVPHEERAFWQRMADDMVHTSETLLHDVDTVFAVRSPQLGFPPIQVFGIAMCGSVFSYLLKWPERESTSSISCGSLLTV